MEMCIITELLTVYGTLCKLWLCLFAVILAGADIPLSPPVLEESCTDDICDRSHISTEQLFDQLSVEHQNKNVPQKSAQEQTSDNAESNAGEDHFKHSSGTLGEDNSYYHANSDHSDEPLKEEIIADKDPDGLENVKAFQENEANELVEPKEPVRNEELDESDILQSNEPTDDSQHETILPELEVVGFDKISVSSSRSDESLKQENSEIQLEQPLPKRRYFPLLYTIRSLFNTLMSEFGDDNGNQETPFNSSDTVTGNLTTPEDRITDLNTTSNATDSSKKTRFQCAVKNITNSTTGEVKIVNSTELLEILNFSKNQKVSPCVLVMFYAPWCHFCARAAPHYNALAQAFPQLDVLAVDTSHFSYLNARFGTVAVPNLMLFHARSAVRFNHTVRVLENFIQFVSNNTGLEPDTSVKLEPAHFIGPLPSVVVRSRDWLLWLAWTFVIICTAYGFIRSQYGQSFITWMRVLWQEHQHIE